MMRIIALLMVVIVLIGMIVGCGRKIQPLETEDTDVESIDSSMEETSVDDELGIDELDSIDEELENLDW